MSSSKQYQTAVVNFNNGSAGYNIFRSSDYGLNWSGYSINYSGSYSCTSVAMSDSGQYQYVGLGDSQNNCLLVSNNYGASFTAYLADKNDGWLPYVCCDSTGQFASVIYSAGGRNFVYTQNYGSNWVNYTYISGTTQSYGTAIACSADGAYVTALGNSSSVAVIRANTLSGQVYSTILTSSFNNVYYNVIAMNSTGDIQVIANTSLGFIYYSTNYGNSWIQIINSITGWRSLSVSDDSTTSKIIFLAGNSTGLYSYNSKTKEEKYALTVKGNASIEGSCTSYGYYATSDYRIKENVIELDEDITNKIDLLRPVMYQNKLNKNIEFGFIAHELQNIFPELVKGNKDDEEHQTVNYIGLLSILIKEVQELKNKIKTLTDK